MSEQRPTGPVVPRSDGLTIRNEQKYKKRTYITGLELVDDGGFPTVVEAQT